MGVAGSIVSTIIKSAAKSEVENELSNELIGISIDSISEKGINKINDFINKGKSKIDNILSEDKMKSLAISEDNMAYVVAEIKGLFSGMEFTDEIFRQCKYDRFILRDFLWNQYTEHKTGFIECESDMKKSLLAISEALIKLMRESEGFVKDISIQISNTVDETRVEIQRISDYLEENVGKISADNQRILDILREMLEQNEENKKGSNITQEEKFQNNKKDKYLKIWNSRLFLHIDNDEKPITLADAFIMPDYKLRNQIRRINFLKTDSMGDVINKFVKYDATSSMLITGAPGIGKTSITAWIANEYKDDDNIIILRFRDWDSEELDNGLLKSICNTLKCKKKELENKVLILDGFDEIRAMDNRDSLLNTFFNDILDFDNLKMIITSRPNYIDSHRFQNVFELLAFEIAKISQFYQIIKDVKLEIDKIDCTNLNVIGIPVILYMAIMSDIDLTQKATKPELYSRIFAEEGGIFDKFCYEGIGYDKGNHILRDRKNVKKYLSFLGEIAFKMFEKNKEILKREEYEVPELDFQGEKVKIVEFPIKYMLENENGNIEFIHKSLYDYFVSDYISKSIEEEGLSVNKFANTLGRLLKSNILSFEILEFLNFKIIHGSLKSGFKLINEAFQVMLNDGMTYHTKECYKMVIDCEINVFANMLEILHFWDVGSIKFDSLIGQYTNYNRKKRLNFSNANLVEANLNQVDLRNINLSNSNLSGACLKGADLRNTNLSNTNLYNANLEEADLRNANLINTNMMNADLRKSDMMNANLTNVDLRKSDLLYANLTNANLKYADLSKADMRNSILSGVILKNAYLVGTLLDETQVDFLEKIYNLQGVVVYLKNEHIQISYEEYCKRKKC